MKKLLIGIFLMIQFPVVALAKNTDKALKSSANIFATSDSGIIEITGESARYIFDRMKDVEGKATFAEITKIGTNIRCAKLGADPAKNPLYKCFFCVGSRGEVESPPDIK